MGANEVLVELEIDGSWVDITSDVYVRDPIAIARGRPDEATASDPGSVELTLNNRHGKYSPRNPASPYYGQLGRNTPVSVWARGAEPYMRPLSIGGRAVAASGTHLDTAGDLDVRVDLSLWTLPSQRAGSAPEVTDIAGRYVISGDHRVWRLVVTDYGRPNLLWSPDGTLGAAVSAVCTVPVPARPGERTALRVTLDVDDGAGGWEVRWYTGDSLAGPWRPLGAPVTGSGTTSVVTGAAADLEVGGIDATGGFVTGYGLYRGFELRDGIDGTVLAGWDTTNFEVGDAGFTDDQSNSWTLDNAVIQNFYPRLLGEVTEWPTRWDTSGADVYTPIQAHGILRRLGQGQPPVQSTLRRRIPSADPAPLAYWPMEESRDASQAYSPIDGVAPLEVSDLDFAADDGLGGSAALPTLGSDAVIRGRVPGASAGGWHVEMVYHLDELPATESTVIRLNISDSDIGIARVRCSTAGIRVQALDADSVVLDENIVTTASLVERFHGPWNRISIFSFVDGSDVLVTMRWRNIVSGGYAWAFATVPGASPGRAVGVQAYYETDIQGMALGHLGVWDIGGTSESTPGVTVYDGADDGYAGESAVARMRRLAEEEGTWLTALGDPDEAATVGPQPVATYLDVVRQAAKADGGVLYERRTSEPRDAGLHYLPQAALYNRRPALTLDYSAGEVAPPLHPVDDDQRTMNDVTVSREGGSSAREVQQGGPLGVDTVGRYATSGTVAVAADDQLDGIAAWRLHLGTWDAARYPMVSINLMNPRMAAHRQQVLDAVDVQSVVRLTGLPDWLPPGPVDLVVEGYSETIGLYTWDVELTCSPAGPWVVGEVAAEDADDDGPAVHVDTDGSALGTGVDATETTLSVVVIDGPDWTTDSADFPFDVEVGGEVMTVTAISGSSPQDFTVTRSVNGISKSHDAGSDVRLAQPMIVAL